MKEARNGEDAISIFQEWHPHFIWMDMRMPVLDGFEATRKIRTLPGGDTVRIVAVTASVLEERHNEILACGCDEVVRKPFKNHEFFDSMTRQLGVKYIYQDRGAEAVQKQVINLTAEMLADLPRELLQELRETTLALNREAIFEIISRISVSRAIRKRLSFWSLAINSSPFISPAPGTASNPCSASHKGAQK